MRALILLFSLVFSLSTATAQYTLRGSAKFSGSECYQLTERKIGENGAVWYDKQLDLRSSFSLEFTLNLDNKPDGADGIVFVMQTVGPMALGANGEGIGFRDFSPSLGIEFDTFRNGNLGDPVYDHTAIQRDGGVNHADKTNLAGPVPIQVGKVNAKDGTDYRVRIDWNAPKQQLTLFINCDQRPMVKTNAVNDIFKGQPMVWWGFTSATGLYYSRQTVCLKNDIVHRDTIQICDGETATLLARESPDNTYSWTPGNLLDNPSSRTPVAHLAKNQLFIAKSQDYCGNVTQDSVFVVVKPRLSLVMGPDQQACTIQNLLITPQVSPSNLPIQYVWSTGEKTPSLTVNKAGTYSLEVTANGCTSRGQIQVTQLPAPQIDTTQTRLFCLGSTGEALLSIHALEPGLSYLWQHDFSNSPTLPVSHPGDYQVLITNPAGCTLTETLTVLYSCSPGLFTPDAFTPNNDGINDVFRLYGEGISSVELVIYNRWGAPIFSTTSLDDYWDGRYRNEPCESGTYAYSLRYQTRFQNQPVSRTGYIMLIR